MMMAIKPKLCWRRPLLVFVLLCFVLSSGWPLDLDGSAAAQERDILTYLNSIPGMEATELQNAPSGYRYFALNYQQPVDHYRDDDDDDDAQDGVFTQRMVLLHRDASEPIVMVTHGYNLSISPGRVSLTRLLNANQLRVEHRYFGPSTPQPRDWDYLTIRQAAADHHRIIQAIRPFYSGKWVTNGASKGGMTAMYHRRFYPNDVDGTVADVAPHSAGRLDRRYVAFQKQVGNAECRRDLKLYQREALNRRDAMTARIQEFADRYNLTFSMPGGLDRVLDLTIGELYFQFWQYGRLEYCALIPTIDADDDAIFDFMVDWGPLYFASDIGIQRFEPYFYQAITQLGYPRLLTEHLEDLLLYDPNDYSAYVLEWPEQDFDRRAMRDVGYWTARKSRNIILTYGEIDPWSAAAFPLPDSAERSTKKFLLAGGNHGTNVSRLAPDDQAEAFAMLEEWTGVTPSLALLQEPQISADTPIDLELELGPERPINR
ncbi:MAG: hypothetical protein MI924_29850 [Chloroflexales bacterium]|nr:hypothetical protein [Chloroflexales bacterium]